jgi:hypothetical protein
VSRLACMKEVDYMYSEIDTTTVNRMKSARAVGADVMS